MNKTAETEWARLFLIEALPEPLTPASAHLQLFDNYIENTRIRLRSVRDPYNKTWTRSLEQRFTVTDESGTLTKTAAIHLNDDEYAVFERFEGREIRKNRYFHEFDRLPFIFDVYLGKLWGLSTAKVEFESWEKMAVLMPPPFGMYEITNEPFFMGHDLVNRTFADVQAEVSKLTPVAPILPDE
jgi:CYTH domain-containing protein